MQVEAVVFDIGNVLIDWQPERYFDAQIGEIGRTALFDAVDINAMLVRIDQGGVFGEVVEDTALAHPDGAREVRWVRDHWNGVAGPEISLSVRLWRALKAKGIIVATVGFELTATSAIDVMNNCASDSGKAYMAENGAQLQAAFKDIADSINRLRLTS